MSCFNINDEIPAGRASNPVLAGKLLDDLLSLKSVCDCDYSLPTEKDGVSHLVVKIPPNVKFSL